MLVYILIFIIAMSAMTVFFVKGMAWAMGKFGGESIARVHREAECITNEGIVPPGWAIPWIKKIDAAAQKDTSGGAITGLKERAKSDCLRKLDNLIRHFERTSIIEDEEVRDIVLKGLNNAKENWNGKSWDELMG